MADVAVMYRLGNLNHNRSQVHHVLVSNPAHLMLQPGVLPTKKLNFDAIVKSSVGARARQVDDDQKSVGWLRPARFLELVKDDEHEQIVAIDDAVDANDPNRLRDTLLRSDAARVLVELRSHIVCVLDREATAQQLLSGRLPGEDKIWKRVTRSGGRPRSFGGATHARAPAFEALLGLEPLEGEFEG